MESTWLMLLVAALGGSLISLTGGLFLIARKVKAERIQRIAIPFAAGALLAAAFFDLIPEAFESQLEAKQVALVMLGGFLLFFVLERFLGWFHHHHGAEQESAQKLKRHRTAATLIVIGDTVHNLIDGVVIGGAFLVDPIVGIVATVAVASHEIPQEIGDFAALLALGMERRQVLIVNLLSAAATVISASAVFALGETVTAFEPLILAATAGLFIYIAASDLIPTIHEEPRARVANVQAVILFIGVALIGATTTFAHGYLTELLPEAHATVEAYNE